MLKEWPLVAFTVAGQMAAGIFLFAGLPLFLSAGAGGNAAAHETQLIVLAVVLGLLAVAALLSFFHLHHPFRARRVLTNLRTSWLSREIFFELGFMALVSMGLFLVWSGWAGTGLTKGIMIAAALLGVLFILSISKLYMLPTVPPWNQAYTPLSFFMTSLSLGALAAALVRASGADMPSRSGAYILLAFVFVAAEAALSFLIAPGHGVFGYRSGPSLRPPAEAHRTLHLARLALLLMGLALIRGAMVAGEGGASGGSGGTGSCPSLLRWSSPARSPAAFSSMASSAGPAAEPLMPSSGFLRGPLLAPGPHARARFFRMGRPSRPRWTGGRIHSPRGC